MQMIPRLLQLGALVGDSVLLKVVEREGYYQSGVGGDHPLVKAFAICEEHDTELQRQSYTYIVKCSYLTLNVLYDIFRLAKLQNVSLKYPDPDDLQELCHTHGETPLKTRIQR
jgi:hypothetical protein